MVKLKLTTLFTGSVMHKIGGIVTVGRFAPIRIGGTPAK